LINHLPPAGATKYRQRGREIMKNIKECPSCGFINKATDKICRNCDFDIIKIQKKTVKTNQEAV